MSQTVFITGATSGIGRHAALYLAARGFRVLGTGRNLAALESLRSEGGENIRVHALDVTSSESIAAVAAWARTECGGGVPDVIVNNAGVGMPGCLADVPMERLRFLFDTNVFGLMEVTKAFLPEMMERGSGRIINVSSVSGRTTVPLMGAYHASKHAVEALSDALRMELSPFGIKVVVIEPGPIDTDIPNRVRSEFDAIVTPQSRYLPVYALADTMFERFSKRAVSPEQTSIAIHAAIAKPSPKHRYVVPWYHILPILIQAHVPSWIADWAVALATGLNARKLRK